MPSSLPIASTSAVDADHQAAGLEDEANAATLATLLNTLYREDLAGTAPATRPPQGQATDLRSTKSTENIATGTPAHRSTELAPAMEPAMVPHYDARTPEIPSVAGSGMGGPFANPAGAHLGRLYFLPGGSPPATNTPVARKFIVQDVRQDFPILQQKVNGRPLVWLDNAATTQKPRSVITALSRFFERDNSNVHRGAHALARRSTDAYEAARDKVGIFLGAALPSEIIFVRGTTEAINLIAQTYGKTHVGAGDEIILTTIEHHSNIVPWQFLSREKGAKLRIVPINNRGEVILEDYAKLLGPRTKIVAFTHVSNALGTVLPVKIMTDMAHAYGARVVVDGAQAVAHFRVNVQTLGCDFYVFSGHKLFAPTGIGALYGRRDLLEEMPPWQGGGSMIDQVTFDNTTFAPVPYKFEAGTGNIAAAVGLGAAIDYINHIGLDAASAYEHKLTNYATQSLSAIRGLRLIGTAAQKVGVFSFVLDGIETERVGKFLDQEGIAVRAGHHCAQPSLQHFNLKSTVRPSIALYNTVADIDALVAAILKAQRVLK